MGYYTDAKAAIMADTNEEIDELLEAAKNSLGFDILEFDEVDRTGRVIKMHEYTKWYTAFPETQNDDLPARWEKFWIVAEDMGYEEESTLRGSFIKIGEDYDDVETSHFGDGEWLVSLSRESKFDLP